MAVVSLEPRLCQGCNGWHPALRTCAGGWHPWDGQPVILERPKRQPVDPALKYTLSTEELEDVVSWLARREAAMRRGGQRTKYRPGGSAEKHAAAELRGGCGEFAASRMTGLPHDRTIIEKWRSTDKRADIGRNVEVRTSTSTRWGVPVYENDPDTRIILFITGETPGPFRLRGWLRAGDGKDSEWWTIEPYPHWAVDVANLHPLPLPDDA